MGDYWKPCTVCGMERKLTGRVFVRHNRAIRVGGETEMALCLGSGTPPAESEDENAAAFESNANKIITERH